jgi:hypothetical protein
LTTGLRSSLLCGYQTVSTTGWTLNSYGDNIINITDALFIAQYTVGLRQYLSCRRCLQNHPEACMYFAPYPDPTPTPVSAQMSRLVSDALVESLPVGDIQQDAYLVKKVGRPSALTEMVFSSQTGSTLTSVCTTNCQLRRGDQLVVEHQLNQPTPTPPSP